MGKTSKAAAAKTSAVKFLVLVVVAIARDLNCIMLNVAFLLVLVDVYLFVHAPE